MELKKKTCTFTGRQTLTVVLVSFAKQEVYKNKKYKAALDLNLPCYYELLSVSS